MYFESVELENWGPFRGEHALELGPGEFGVVGEWDHDPLRRSNYAGKSRLLGALYFLVTGVLPDECQYEDDWVTEGESGGSVTGVLSHAGEQVLKIRRERRSGNPIVKAALPGEEPVAKGAAEALIQRVVGLPTDELFATWFTRQKEIARFVTALPSDRAKVVEDWFPELEKIRTAASLVRLSDAADHATQLKSKLEDARNDFAARGSLGFFENIDTRLVLATQEVERLAAEHHRLEDECAEALAEDKVRREREARGRQLEADQAEHKELLDEIARLETELLASKWNLPPTGDEHDQEMKAGQAAAKAEEERDVARTVSRGLFDGKCPVNGCACPVRDEINQSGQAGRARLDEAEATLAEASRRHQEASAAAKESRAREKAGARLSAVLEGKRAAVARAAKRVEEAWAAGVRPPALSGRLPGETGAKLQELEEKRARASVALSAAKSDELGLIHGIAERDRLLSKLEELRHELAKAEKQLEVRRLARLCLGPGGAQKDFVEGRLGRIEAAANAVLQSAAIEQRVGLRWGRQIQGLANHCDACGHPFPKRQGVKVCERCGAERGPKVAWELDVPIAHRSGGGDDLAGLVVRMGAAAWLTARRGSPWSSFVVDEPHGSLDQAHRDAVCQLFSGLARGMLGVKAEQVIVVSHSQEVIARMPRRIVVTARRDGSGSSVRVE